MSKEEIKTDLLNDKNATTEGSNIDADKSEHILNTNVPLSTENVGDKDLKSHDKNTETKTQKEKITEQPKSQPNNDDKTKMSSSEPQSHEFTNYDPSKVDLLNLISLLENENESNLKARLAQIKQDLSRNIKENNSIDKTAKPSSQNLPQGDTRSALETKQNKRDRSQEKLCPDLSLRLKLIDIDKELGLDEDLDQINFETNSDSNTQCKNKSIGLKKSGFFDAITNKVVLEPCDSDISDDDEIVSNRKTLDPNYRRERAKISSCRLFLDIKNQLDLVSSSGGTKEVDFCKITQVISKRLSKYNKKLINGETLPSGPTRWFNRWNYLECKRILFLKSGIIGTSQNLTESSKQDIFELNDSDISDKDETLDNNETKDLLKNQPKGQTPSCRLFLEIKQKLDSISCGATNKSNDFDAIINILTDRIDRYNKKIMNGKILSTGPMKWLNRWKYLKSKSLFMLKYGIIKIRKTNQNVLNMEARRKRKYRHQKRFEENKRKLEEIDRELGLEDLNNVNPNPNQDSTVSQESQKNPEEINPKTKLDSSNQIILGLVHSETTLDSTSFTESSHKCVEPTFDADISDEDNNQILDKKEKTKEKQKEYIVSCRLFFDIKKKLELLGTSGDANADNTDFAEITEIINKRLSKYNQMLINGETLRAGPRKWFNRWTYLQYKRMLILKSGVISKIQHLTESTEQNIFEPSDSDISDESSKYIETNDLVKKQERAKMLSNRSFFKIKQKLDLILSNGDVELNDFKEITQTIRDKLINYNKRLTDDRTLSAEAIKWLNRWNFLESKRLLILKFVVLKVDTPLIDRPKATIGDFNLVNADSINKDPANFVQVLEISESNLPENSDQMFRDLKENSEIMIESTIDQDKARESSKIMEKVQEKRWSSLRMKLIDIDKELGLDQIKFKSKGDSEDTRHTSECINQKTLLPKNVSRINDSKISLDSTSVTTKEVLEAFDSDISDEDESQILGNGEPAIFKVEAKIVSFLDIKEKLELLSTTGDASAINFCEITQILSERLIKYDKRLINGETLSVGSMRWLNRWNYLEFQRIRILKSGIVSNTQRLNESTEPEILEFNDSDISDEDDVGQTIDHNETNNFLERQQKDKTLLFFEIKRKLDLICFTTDVLTNDFDKITKILSDRISRYNKRIMNGKTLSAGATKWLNRWNYLENKRLLILKYEIVGVNDKNSQHSEPKNSETNKTVSNPFQLWKELNGESGTKKSSRKRPSKRRRQWLKKMRMQMQMDEAATDEKQTSNNKPTNFEEKTSGIASLQTSDYKDNPTDQKQTSNNKQTNSEEKTSIKASLETSNCESNTLHNRTKKINHTLSMNLQHTNANTAKNSNDTNSPSPKRADRNFSKSGIIRPLYSSNSKPSPTQYIEIDDSSSLPAVSPVIQQNQYSLAPAPASQPLVDPNPFGFEFSRPPPVLYHPHQEIHPIYDPNTDPSVPTTLPPAEISGHPAIYNFKPPVSGLNQQKIPPTFHMNNQHNYGIEGPTQTVGPEQAKRLKLISSSKKINNRKPKPPRPPEIRKTATCLHTPGPSQRVSSFEMSSTKKSSNENPVDQFDKFAYNKAINTRSPYVTLFETTSTKDLADQNVNVLQRFAHNEKVEKDERTRRNYQILVLSNRQKGIVYPNELEPIKRYLVAEMIKTMIAAGSGPDGPELHFSQTVLLKPGWLSVYAENDISFAWLLTGWEPLHLNNVEFKPIRALDMFRIYLTISAPFIDMAMLLSILFVQNRSLEMNKWTHLETSGHPGVWEVIFLVPSEVIDLLKAQGWTVYYEMDKLNVTLLPLFDG